MSMSLGMSLSLSPRLEQNQRMKLEQKLESKLEHQQALTLSLGQYLQKEDIIQGFIRYANDHNTWTSFEKEGFNFSYARLPYKIAKPIADKTGVGFAHCLYNPFEGLVAGHWTLFVVHDLIPKKFEEIVALHERGEEISLGNHYFASQLEFSYAKKIRTEKTYREWIDQEYPSKFVDLTQEVLFPILPEEVLERLKGRRNEKEISVSENMINEHPFSTGLLKLMNRYEIETIRLANRVHKQASGTQGKIIKQIVSAPRFSIAENALTIGKDLSDIMKEISPRRYQVVSKIRIEQEYGLFKKIVLDEVFKLHEKHIILPENFNAAYYDFQDNKPLASV